MTEQQQCPRSEERSNSKHGPSKCTGEVTAEPGGVLGVRWECEFHRTERVRLDAEDTFWEAHYAAGDAEAVRDA